jgi:hypothetical protein
MKPTIIQFEMWIDMMIRGNEYLHMKKYETALQRMSSLSADPADVAHFDKRAAELLTNARAAHDELAAYLRSRKEGT